MKALKCKLLFIWLAWIFVVFTSFTKAQNAVNNTGPVSYYVSTSGEDFNSGYSVSTPFKTIAAANAVVQPGDTVFLRAGDYNDPIQPAISGQAGKYITYKAFYSERPTLTATKDPKIAVNLPYGINYVCVDGVYADGRGEHYTAYNSTINTWLVIGGSYNIIQNCNFKSALGWYGVEIKESGTYNQILNNRMDLIGTVNIAITPNNESKADMISIEGKYNLFEGNHFSRGGHNIIGTSQTSKYNVIRNNLIENDWGDGNRYRGFAPKGINLWEGNIITKCGYVEGQRTTMGVGTFQFDGTYSIIRRNIFMNNYAKGMNGGCTKNRLVQGLRVFHNVFFNHASSVFSFGGDTDEWCTQNPASHNHFKNNIIYNDGSMPVDPKFTSDAFINFRSGGKIAENKYIANSFYELGKEVMVASPNDYGIKSLVEMEGLAPANFSGNLIARPLFTIATPDSYEHFHLLSESPQIDAGSFLTVTVGAGSGKSLKVDDALYFCDGFGLIGGDRIQLEGQTIAATVLNVNYETNTLTLDRDLNWTNGQGVSLEYKGTRPDIGAHESLLVSAPSFNPASGTYAGVMSVTISSSTSSATIRYTTDGSDPTETNGTLYTAPVAVSEATTLKAIAYKSGVGTSTVSSSVYTMQVSAPDFSPVPENYEISQAIAISSATTGATIRYTTDGTNPTETFGTVYTIPVLINETTTLKAIAYKTGMISSTVTSGQYTFATVDTVVLTPEADAFINEALPDDKLGKQDRLVIRTPGREAYLRFDLSGISGTVISAILTLYSTSSSAKVIHKIAYVSNDNWSETDITWNNNNLIGDQVNSLDMKTVGTINEYTDFTITSKVQEEKGGKISLKLYAEQNISPHLTYASREHSTAVFRPRLTVINSPVSTTSNELNSENTLDQIWVYPNPTFDRIFLHGIDAANTSAQLIDLQCRVIKQVSNSNTIEMNGVSKGFYLVKVKADQQTKIVKVFIER